VLTIRNAKDWKPLVETVCKMSPPVKAALAADHRDQLNVLLATDEHTTSVIRNHAQMLSVLFPWLGFKLLVKAPRFGPSINRRNSH